MSNDTATSKQRNTMRVRKNTSVQAVTDFICRYAPRGATGHSGGDFYVWLLKPTAKGGTTLARVLVNHDASDVYEAAWVAAYAITTAKRTQDLTDFDEHDDINYTEVGDGSSND